MNAVTAGAKDEFARLGVSVVAQTDAGFDAAKQKSDVETILAKKPSAILALPLDPVTSAEAFKPAVASGVKIVLLSNKPKGFVQGKDYVVDRHRRSVPDGQARRRRARRRHRRQGQGRLHLPRRAILRDQPARPGVQDHASRSDYPDIKIVASAGIADPARAEDIAHALLVKNPDLDGIYVTWAEPAEGVLAALRAAGNTKTKIVTLDLSEPVALDMVKGGNVAAIVADKAYELGRAMADAAGYGLIGKTGAGLRRRAGADRHQGQCRAGLAGVAASRRAEVGARRGQIAMSATPRAQGAGLDRRACRARGSAGSSSMAASC